MNKHILVAGGAGFIGSHLCRQLLADGHTVVCCDNFYTGKKSNIKELITHPRFVCLEQSIQEPVHGCFDEIYNLACPASPLAYARDPVYTLDSCYIGTRNLLDLSIRCNAKILHASTSEVYGDPLTHPQRESYWGNVNPIGARSCYDEGKRAAEALLVAYQKRYKAKIKIVRIFNTYGPMMSLDDGRVVSNLIVQALKGDDLTVYGSGEQTRSFCFITDLVAGLLRMMDSADDFTGPVNLGNPQEFTINELLDLIQKITSTNSPIRHLELPSDDPVRRRPDITQAKCKLNWTPKVELKEGLISTVEYFQKLLKGSCQ